MRSVRQHLSFANVASAIALFIAVGGGSAFALAGHNTVFSNDIAPKQVRPADVKPNSLGTGSINESTFRRLQYGHASYLDTAPAATILKWPELGAAVVSPGDGNKAIKVKNTRSSGNLLVCWGGSCYYVTPGSSEGDLPKSDAADTFAEVLITRPGDMSRALIVHCGFGNSVNASENQTLCWAERSKEN